MWRVVSAIASLLFPTLAFAHGGNPAVADILSPQHLCPVADRSTAFDWVDADSPAPSGAATIDFFATQTLPPTFTRDLFPPELERRVIATGVLEPDLANTLIWDTSTVATGVYWIWSRVHEPPAEMSAELIGISPVPVVVHHDGDALPLAIAITRPNSSFAIADQTYRVEYEALESTGTGRVRFEAKPFLGNDWFLVADGLPAGVDGSFEWNTSALPTGDWMMRATLTNCFGASAVTHTRFIFNVSHPGQPPPDAGAPPDAGSIDAVVPDWCNDPPVDAGLDQCGVINVPIPDASTVDAGSGEEPGGCDCNLHRSRTPSYALLLLFTLRRGLRRRSRASTR